MSNPFDDDDVPKYSKNTSAEKDIEDYERQIESLMVDSLASTQRSRAQLEHSEQLGTQTAQNLLEQREKLERTERNLQDIHYTTQQTQRSLNSLKSVFTGFFKNKFSKAPQKPDALAEIPSSSSSNKLNKAVENVNSSSAAPVASTGPSLGAESRKAIAGTRWEAMDNELDENLEGMSGQLARLRMMGQAIGEEVDDQNKMLDRIQVAAERNDSVVRSQDNQMKRLLGYKPEPIPRS